MLKRIRIRGKLRSWRKGTTAPFLLTIDQHFKNSSFTASPMGIRQFRTFILATWPLMDDFLGRA